jgi:integrase
MAHSTRPSGSRDSGKAPKAARPKKGKRKAKAPRKPKKPRPDFPLFANGNGYWSKKCKGKVVNFGRWARVVDGVLTPVDYDQGWIDAERTYNLRYADVVAGRVRGTVVSDDPSSRSDGDVTMGVLRDRFLTAKSDALDAGDIVPRSYFDYKATMLMLIQQFGEHRRVDDLTPADFENLKRYMTRDRDWGPSKRGNEITRVKMVFKFAYDSELIDSPIRFGQSFKKPPKRLMRQHRQEGGKKLFTREEILSLLDGKTVTEKAKKKKLAGATPALRAMILLGINCGFGNSDVSSLQRSAIDFKKGWIDYPRPKTGVDRRCKLWPETIAALQAAIAERPKPNLPADDDCVFLTQKGGNRWVRIEVGKSGGMVQCNCVSQEFKKLLQRLDINGRRGLGFYSLRHTFRTIADATKDFPAVRFIMGHADSSIDDAYREEIDDSRLEAVVQHVRAWLFG